MVAQSFLDRLAYDSVLKERVAPAAALGFAARTAGGWGYSVGAAGSTPSGPATAETVFDLASVTKPFIAVLFARLLARGVVSPRTELQSHLPEARGTAGARSTLEQLLSHRAGFAPHRALYLPLLRQEPFSRVEALESAARARSAEGEGGPAPCAPVYSDLGYLLAGELMERACNAPLDALVEELVTQPLGVTARSARQWLARGESFQWRVAPTEYVGFRGGLVRGIVHDENAWALAGHGLAGHAGLFGTAEAVLRFGTALLDALAGRAPHFLTPELGRTLVQPRAGGSLRLGFDGKSGPDSSAGATASPETFGHLGFTGTSLWCDPTAECVTVLLTNRVCPTRDNARIRAARPRVHDALFRHARPRSPD